MAKLVGCLYPIAAHMRTRSDMSVYYLRVGSVSYVLKLADTKLRGKAIYDALRNTKSTVRCVFSGYCTLNSQGVIHGIKINNENVNIAPHLSIYKHFSTKIPENKIHLHAIVTEYCPRVISAAEAARLRGAEIINSEYTTNLLRLLCRLYRTHGFVHWDLHHHNQLINLTTREPLLLDFDFSTVSGKTDSGVYETLDVDLFVNFLRHITDSLNIKKDTRQLSRNCIGHAYDKIMILLSHDAYYRATRCVYTPINDDEKRILKYYIHARRIMSAVDWEKHVRALLSKPIVANRRAHYRVLFKAVLFVTMERYSVTREALTKQLSKTIIPSIGSRNSST